MTEAEMRLALDEVRRAMVAVAARGGGWIRNYFPECVRPAISGCYPEVLKCDRPVRHDGDHESTSGTTVTREELRHLLEQSVKGAEELGRSLKACFRLPDVDYLDSSSAPHRLAPACAEGEGEGGA